MKQLGLYLEAMFTGWARGPLRRLAHSSCYDWTWPQRDPTFRGPGEKRESAKGTKRSCPTQQADGQPRRCPTKEEGDQLGLPLSGSGGVVKPPHARGSQEGAAGSREGCFKIARERASVVPSEVSAVWEAEAG